MTDSELKTLIASVAAVQVETAAQMKRTDARLEELAAAQVEIAAQQKKTDAQMKGTDALLKELAAAQVETDAQMKRTDARLEELAAAQIKTDAQMKRTDARLDGALDELRQVSGRLDRATVGLETVSKRFGGVSGNQGSVAEEYFYNSLDANPVELGGVRFSDVRKLDPDPSVSKEKSPFDLLLVNGQEMLAVEVKYKVHEDDIEHLLETKIPNFQRLYPEYAEYRQRFALATFHIDDELKKKALSRGISVLQRKGDVIVDMAA